MTMTFRSSPLLSGLSATLVAALWSFPASAGNAPAAVPPHSVPGNPPVVVIDEPVPLVLVRIGGGRFRMGDTQSIGQADERPVRGVRVGDFWMMRTEVTRGMFARFVEDTAHETGSKCWAFESGWKEKVGPSWRNPGFEQGADHPVTCVNWHDARAFADWLGSKTGMAFRLPSEAEWEYAARAGTDTVYHWGEDPSRLCENANGADTRALEHYPGFSVNQCDDGFVRTSPVGTYPANPWGIQDLYGNVWEWVEDCWNDSYNDAPTNGGAWQTGDCARRGFRGGGYGDIPRFARSTLRNRSEAEHRKDDIGFRLVVDEPVALTGRP
jgi:formylglycine-generating enzyme required for sulfatase activity